MAQFNYIQDGDILPLPAPADVQAGDGALVGSIFGVAQVNAASGATGQFATCGVFALKKTSAQVWTVGAVIYWDNTAKECTTTATSNTKIGAAIAAAANPSGVGYVRLNGTV